MKTKQEIFDTVTAHLLKQNEKALVGDNCVYRGSKGLRCAVGCLIPDGLYDPIIEGYAVPIHSTTEPASSLGIRKMDEILSASGIEGLDERSLLLRLQDIHDVCAVEHWARRLKELAHKFGLEYHGKGTP